MDTRVGLLVLASAVTLPPCGLTAEPADDVTARLARMPRPWLKRPRRPTLEEYTETLRYWAEKRPKLLTVRKRGASAEGLPIFLVKVTDADVPDADKHVVLVTGLHSGGERTGGMAVLHAIEWLLGPSESARRTRRTHVVLAMPIVNPRGFFVREGAVNSSGIDPYSANRGAAFEVASLTLKEPAKAPEIAAFMAVVDEYRPDVHVDMHGVALHYNGHLVAASVGSAGSNNALRPWDWRTSEAMVRAGQAAGYGYHRMECDAQRLFGGGALEPLDDAFWYGRPYFYTAMYAYMKCHTMPITMEVGWETGGLAALKGLFEVGNKQVGQGQRTGYPVDVVKSINKHAVCAYGRTAAERRASRVELWRRQGEIAVGLLYPETDCREMLVCAVGQVGLESAFRGAAASGRWGNIATDRLIANMREVPFVQADAVKAFVDAGPPPQRRVLFEKGTSKPDRPDAPLRGGLAMRLRISYPDPELLDLRLNGHELPPSPTDGFERWHADGYTQLRINVPPDKANARNVFVVTCAYRPRTARQHGWRPPDEVVERLAKRKRRPGSRPR